MENQFKIDTIRKWLGNGSINIFGRQFAGKDTHGRELVALFNGVLLGGGDILRNSVIPEQVKSIMHAGELIPTQDYINIVLPYLSKQEFQDGPLILSAVGRWLGEEEGVIEAAKAAGHELKAVIYLNIQESVSYDRWEKSFNVGDRDARIDDSKESLTTRLAEFQNKTIPVIEAYKDKGLLIEVDGTLDRDVVLNKIIDALYEFSQRKS